MHFILKGIRVFQEVEDTCKQNSWDITEMYQDNREAQQVGEKNRDSFTAVFVMLYQ